MKKKKDLLAFLLRIKSGKNKLFGIGVAIICLASVLFTGGSFGFLDVQAQTQAKEFVIKKASVSNTKETAKEITSGKIVSSGIKDGEKHYYKISIPSDTDYKTVSLDIRSSGEISYSFLLNADFSDMVMEMTADVPIGYGLSEWERENFFDIVDHDKVHVGTGDTFGKLGKGYTYYFIVSGEGEYAFRISFASSKNFLVKCVVKKGKKNLTVCQYTFIADDYSITVKSKKKILLKDGKSMKKITYQHKARNNIMTFKLKRALKKGDVITVQIKNKGYKTYKKVFKL